jgi:hypothetical protein
MSTYRYKSDTANSQAVYKFFAFGFVSSFGVVIPAGVYIVLLNINGCGYIGYRAAVALLPIIQIAAWLLVSLGMCAVYAALTQSDPPTPPAGRQKTSAVTRSIKGSVRGRGGKFTYHD